MITIAIEAGRVNIADQLIKAGADVNLQETLICAAKCRSAEYLKLLIEAGADVNNTNGSVALCSAAQTGSVECVNLLLLAGVDVNTRWREASALYHAIGNSDCVEALVKAGAEIDEGSFRRAGQTGSEQCVQLLMEAGGDVNMMFTETLKFDSENLVDLLLKGGAQITEEALQSAEKYNYNIVKKASEGWCGS